MREEDEEDWRDGPIVDGGLAELSAIAVAFQALRTPDYLKKKCAPSSEKPAQGG